MSADFVAVTPLLVVALSACAVLLAEAYRRPDENPPHGLLGGIGLVGAIVASMFLWKRDMVGFGVIVIDHYSLFFNIVICGIGLLTILLSSGTASRDRLPTGEYRVAVFPALYDQPIDGMMFPKPDKSKPGMTRAPDIPLLYRDVTTSGLTAQVTTSNNDFRFDLKSDSKPLPN